MSSSCLLALLAVGATSGPVTVDEVLSAPLYWGLTAAPAGGRLAWIENRLGVRNVWVASGPSLKPMRITAFDRDDGQELSELAISPDGKAVAFVRGQRAEGRAVDPLSTAEGAKVELWVWRDGALAQRFTEGGAPSFSPDGASLAFISDGKILVAKVRAPMKVERTLAVRGQLGSARWSPDGTRIAFVSDRADHALIGVWTLATGAVVWLSPGIFSDRAQAWSPDGKRIAFLRMPVGAWGGPVTPTVNIEFEGALEIWIADASTGKAVRIFRSSDRTAGEAQDEEDDPLQWGKGDQLVFPWERDGWVRLYSLSVAGGEPKALSPAGCEARSARLCANGAEVLFTSNCGDLDRSHVWSVPIGGGEVRALSPGMGVETSAVCSAGTVAFLASAARQPATPMVLEGAAATARPLVLPVGFWPSERLVEPEAVLLKAKDGLVIHAQLFRRADVPGRRAAIVFVHGGPQRQMQLGWHHLPYYARNYAFNQHLASEGYVVLSVNFRGGTGYGRDFRVPRGFGATGASEYQDVLSAAAWLSERPDVDRARVGIWGGSWGGYLTALALARDSKVFAAGVDLHGVHDWVAALRHDQPSAAWTPADLQLAGASSPLAAIEGWRSPVLLIHGDQDPMVQFSQSVDLVQRLQALPHPPEVETLVLPDEVHRFARHASWVTAFSAASEFFDRRLISR